jgi:hypothetical protein
MTSRSAGRPVSGSTTTKCSFSLNTVVYDDLKHIADNLGVSRSVFLSMLLAESLPALRKASDLMKSKQEGHIDSALIYAQKSKELLDYRIAELRRNKDGRKPS